MKQLFEISPLPLKRRQFLKASAAATGGLVIGFYLPGGNKIAAAQTPPKPNTTPNAFLRIARDGSVTVQVKHLALLATIAELGPSNYNLNYHYLLDFLFLLVSLNFILFSNDYYYQTGKPDSFQVDLDRYRAVTAADVQRVVKKYLQANRVMISVVPQGKPELAAKKGVAQ